MTPADNRENASKCKIKYQVKSLSSKHNSKKKSSDTRKNKLQSAKKIQGFAKLCHQNNSSKCSVCFNEQYYVTIYTQMMNFILMHMFHAIIRYNMPKHV